MSPAGPPPTMHAPTRVLGTPMASRYQRRRGQSGHRVAEVAPGPEASREGPHPFDAATSQDQRHTGARGFVRSGAVEDDLALARDLPVAAVHVLDRHVERAGDDRGLGLEIDPVAHVDDQDLLAAVEL